MNEAKKIELMSKKIIKSSILKYSNITLFERREKKYKSEKKEKKKAPKLFKTTKFFQKKVDTKENFLEPFCRTMSSFHFSGKSSNILPLLDIYENEATKHNKNHNNKNKNKNLYNIKNKKNQTANNFYYLTETSRINAGNNNNIKNISKIINKDKDKKDDFSIETLLLIQTYRNNENKNNKNNRLKISSYLSDKNRSQTYRKHYSFIKTDINKNNLEKNTEDEQNNKKILNCKISKYNHYKEPKFKDFIKKTQELKILSYAAKIKKERAIRLEEGYYNQIEFYEDTIKSLKSAHKLLDIQFSIKIADYTRYVISKREREKVKSSKLIQEIINHKKDIEHIKNKISKIELEKSNIIKWIYFMIQMKEKKLSLPNYYKNIFEKVKERKLSRKPTRKDANKNMKKSTRKLSFFLNESNIYSSNKDNNISNNINENNTENNNLNSSINSNLIINAIINTSIYNNINRKEEYDKIIYYKNNLIFQTPEEFQDRLTSFEKENLVLLQYNNELSHQLFRYKKELNSYINEENNIESKSYQIKEKEKELINIKNIVKDKIKLISDFKKIEKNLEIEFKKERDKRKAIKSRKKSMRIIDNNLDINININKEKNISNENKNTLLYRKINNIYEECKIIGSQLKYAVFILNLVNKKIYTKEKEMILMLEFIEQTVDYLINTFNSYINKSEEIKEFIKKVKMDIEKEHKIEKARLQMIIDLQKIKMLKEKVEKRSNKIYFLPSKKIDLSKFKIKKEKKIVDKDLNRIPTIEDYLYNEKEMDDK